MAAFRVAKPQALRLFQYVRHLRFRFDPFRPDSRAVRETWRQLASPSMVASNPKCTVEVAPARGTSPAIDVTFVDGSKRALERPGRPAAALVAEIYRAAHDLSLEYAIEGKPPPG
mmetsp:Transcript_18620/g.58189  ORF Transcript_18620/g.58189 Transcript_18620/m.58189 type:complete len:115 (-) Transcript_18620:18-362(-)